MSRRVDHTCGRPAGHSNPTRPICFTRATRQYPRRQTRHPPAPPVTPYAAHTHAPACTPMAPLPPLLAPSLRPSLTYVALLLSDLVLQRGHVLLLALAGLLGGHAVAQQPAGEGATRPDRGTSVGARVRGNTGWERNYVVLALGRMHDSKTSELTHCTTCTAAPLCPLMGTRPTPLTS